MKRQARSSGKYPKPACCIERKPTPQSVFFCDTFINLSTISLYTSLSISFISMIFSGLRQPSMSSIKKIATALNMDLGTFVKRLEEHVGRKELYLKKAANS